MTFFASIPDFTDGHGWGWWMVEQLLGIAFSIVVTLVFMLVLMLLNKLYHPLKRILPKYCFHLLMWPASFLRWILYVFDIDNESIRRFRYRLTHKPTKIKRKAPKVNNS